MGIYNQSTVRPEIQSFFIHNTEFVDEFDKSEYCQTGDSVFCLLPALNFGMNVCIYNQKHCQIVDSVFFYTHNTEFWDECLYL